MNGSLIGMRGRYAGAAFLWAIGVIALLAFPGGTPGRVTSHTVWVVLNLLAGLASWSRANAEPAGRRGWQLIAASWFMATAYSAIRLAELTVHTPAPDLVLVVLTMAPYPVAIVGLLQWPIAHRRHRLRAVLDAAIFAGSLFFLSWAAGLGASVRASGLDAVEIALNLAWFAGATLLVGMIAYAAGRSLDRVNGPLGFIGLGIVISMVSAAVSARLTMIGTHFQAHPVELLWLMLPLCSTLAALSPHPVTVAPDPEDRDPTSFAGDVITYLPAGAVLTVSLLTGATGDRVLVMLGLAIGAAFIVRQFLALYDGRRLSNELERKVEERTRQLKASQAALVRSERIQAIGQVSVGVAHDFGNILQAIYNQVDLLRLSVEGDTPIKRLDAMARAAQSGSELVRSLLRLGNPGHGEPIELDLAALVRGMRWVFRDVIDAGVDVDLTGLHPARVLADQGQIEQVVSNLVVNARDALDGSGRLVVETDLLPRAHDRDGTWVRIAVVDTGCGMAPDVAARIFEPFFTTKRSHHGTGLGLPTVYAIVSELGGTINVRSAPGEGSCFEVLLPAQAGQPGS